MYQPMPMMNMLIKLLMPYMSSIQNTYSKVLHWNFATPRLIKFQ
jgi:hypothetical protein